MANANPAPPPLVPPNNAAGVLLPPNPQNPPILGDVSNAQDYIKRLNSSRRSGLVQPATPTEIGQAEAYKAAVLFSSQPAGNIAPQWLQALVANITSLTADMRTVKADMTNVKADISAIRALAENTQRGLRNRKRRDGSFLPLLKWKPGHGAELARAAAPPNSPDTNIADPAAANVAAIGSTPIFNFDFARPSTLTSLQITRLIVFYNDDFGIINSDEVSARREKYRWFLQNEED